MKNDRPTIEHLSIDALVPYARNSRTHSAEQVAQIAGSIKEFGFTNPVLIDADSGIIAGHGRVMAARKLGLTEVPCIRLGYLTDAQKRAYVIADNKLALNAGWDDEMLRLELGELREASVDLSLVGFTEQEIDEFTALVPEFEPGTEGDQGKLDELAPKMVKCPTCNHVFNSRGYEQD
jgi:ParB-like chromosome segregation protein Spo0J